MTRHRNLADDSKNVEKQCAKCAKFQGAFIEEVAWIKRKTYFSRRVSTSQGLKANERISYSDKDLFKREKNVISFSKFRVSRKAR